MLFFKRHFITLIRQGKKSQTIRFWKTPRVRADQIAFVPGLGHIRIRAVDEIASLKSLTAADAHADGFKTRRELLAALRRLYGTLPPDRRIFRITFTWPTAPRAKIPQRAKRHAPAASRRRHLLKKFIVDHAPSPASASRR